MNLGRFEVVESDAGWFARYVGSAGPRTYEWSTRPYPNRRRALVAIYSLTGHTPQPANGFPAEWQAFVQMPTHIAEVRDVDERRPGLEHGRANTHDRYKCRCGPCREARAEYVGSGVPDGADT